MRTSILDEFPDADISVSVVWIHMLPDDTKETTRTSTGIIDDPRARHFHDPKQRIGAAIADGLEWAGRIAWDIYLFYDRDGKWTEGPPVPVALMHQLPWDNARFRTGDDLVKGLSEAMQKMLEKAKG